MASENTVLYSATLGGFFSPGVSDNVPADAVSIALSVYLELLGGQEAGLEIVPSEQGMPMLRARLGPNRAQQQAVERSWRDDVLQHTDRSVARHRDEIDLGAISSLTIVQFGELLGYRQALREWPLSAAFPDASKRPVAPVWLASVTP
ncbi:phage tail protein [Pseudomonas sp. SDI]|uniref:phage tail assembly chaperone n=1 Tax=Pseudomonas sp. SDI TaxID=2170734 RepID=UPI000DE60F33|nr:phage tail assembly chaperone [Pseudomonas sp. SDI]PWB34617.1 phage tail protein [Pseudomonas sp. SDI]